MSATDSLLGRQLANFRVERLLGRGGMANVYYGRDVKLQRPVAIKVISARFRHNQEYARRFVQEARAVATWWHENIVQVYYADDQDGLYYFVMEYIDGLDLATLLDQYAAEGTLMPHADVLRIGKAMASALDYAHAKGVIHRDVKPANIMIATDDRVVLTDFGLALVVSQETQGTTFGTPHYIAPEQARNSAEAVPQSDLYALGVILYEMLTGSVPFDDESLTALAMQHLMKPPPPPREINPNLSLEVERVLLTALEKRPEDRYQSGVALLVALEEAIKNSPPPDAPDRPLPPMPAAVAPELSRMTVAERVQVHARHSVTPPLYQPAEADQPPLESPVAQPAAQQRRRRRPLLLMGIGILLACLVAGGGLALYAMLGGDDSEAEPTAPAVAGDVTETATPSPTLEPTSVTPSITPTLTATPQPSATPSLTPSEAASVTAAPTQTPQPPAATATSTPSTPTATSEEVAPLAEPTIKYPDGRHTTLIYDYNSLYWWNHTSERIHVGPVGFIALNANGEPTARAFTSDRWTRFFAYAEVNGCMAIEVSASAPWLRPGDCRHLNAITTPSRISDLVFWTTVPDNTTGAFAVLWQDEEIARCPLAAEAGNALRCEVYLP